MDEQTEREDSAEIAAIASALTELITRLDAQGRRIEAAHVSMAVDLLALPQKKGSTDVPSTH